MDKPYLTNTLNNLAGRDISCHDVAQVLYQYQYRNSFSLQGVLETKLRLLPVEPDPGNAGEGKEKKMATVNVAICISIIKCFPSSAR